MRTKDFIERVIATLRASSVSANNVHATLDEALTACGSAKEGPKIWAVISAGGAEVTAAVHKALAAGGARLGVVIAAAEGSVSQIEALRAMEYGDIFVAAHVFDESMDKRTADLYREACEYTSGPALILSAAKDAVVSDENWTSFSYDLRREAAGTSAFLTDGGYVRKEIQSFLDRESLLTMVARVALPAEVTAEEEANLAEGLGAAARTVTILYTSDTGHAEECAKAVARQCRNGGFANSAIRCGTLDSYDVGALSSEPLLILCAATAGKGEFPGNGRSFWEKLKARSQELDGNLKDLKYCVFGLGDSHYWGKGTEDSKVNFARPSRLLDEALEKLGAQRLIPTGFGDDQDVDQYHTGFGEWKSQLFSKLGVNKVGASAADDEGPAKSDEVIKIESKQLRSTLKADLDDVTTGTLPSAQIKLNKFHGCIHQDNRELREERQKLGIENAFAFMIRLRAPAGYLAPKQWLALDDICGRYGNGTMKITTRQTFQLHGIVKRDLKATLRAINRACMDTVATSGDCCRNMLCTSNPSVCSAKIMNEIVAHTNAIHDHCLPRSGAYHEIFLMHGDEMAEKTQILGCTPVEEEPLFGLSYLPRKIKAAVAIPPSNDVDVFAQCLGFIAIIKDDQLLGFNVTVGGGMGFTHNNQKTFPRVADVLGFCEPQDAKYVAEAVLLVSREFGDRTNRKHARMKYTIEDYGPDFYREQVEDRLGKKLEAARPFKFEYRGDLFGWTRTEDGRWHCGCQVPIGRVKDQWRIGLSKIAKVLDDEGGFRMTANQQVVVVGVPDSKKAAIQGILDEHGIAHSEATTVSGLRRNMTACSALPTCPVAFAESERYLPTLVGRLESVMERCGLRDRDIVIRMSGCPNSCSRTSMGEIGFIGKAPGTYNMYLGGDFVGQRLNTLFAESVCEDQIMELLTPIIGQYASEREKNEAFGDFVVRRGYVKAMTAGRHWWTTPKV